MNKIFNDEEGKLKALVSQLYEFNPMTSNPIDEIIDYAGSVRWGEIKGRIETQLDLINLLSALKEELEEEISTKTETLFRYKGSVNTFSDLPSNAETGDCYNVTEDGANYAWNGSEWDKLSETIDLSVFLTIEQFENKILEYIKKEEVTEQINDIRNEINTQINEKEQAINDSIDLVKETFNNYYDKDEIDTKESAVIGIINTEIENRQNYDESLSNRIQTLEGKDNVIYTDISNPENPNRKAVILNNHDGVFGKDTEGNTRLIAMMSKYNVADFGAKDTHTNLNTQQIVTVNDNQAIITDKNINQIIQKGDNINLDVRTVTDPSTGFEFNQLVISSDLTNITNDITSLNNRLIDDEATIAGKADSDVVYTKEEADTKFITEHQDISGKADKSVVEVNTGNITSLELRLSSLEDKVADIKKTNIEIPTIEDGKVEVNDVTKDVIIKGELTDTSVINAKSIDIKESTVDKAVLKLTAEDVTLKGVEVEGAYNKATQGNAIASIHSDGYVTIKDCTITATGYNCVEIGLTTGSVKNVLIDNVNFEGTFTNNAISIFQTDEDAVVTISNCHFENVSNVLRLSNTTGAKATYNIINCTVDKWQPSGDYVGLILLQDYTSANEEQVVANNLFKPLTINIQNLIKPDGTKLEPVELSTIVCSHDENQIIYSYADRGTPQLRPYNVDELPTIHIQ